VEGAGFGHGEGSLGQHLQQEPMRGAMSWREQTWEREWAGILQGVHVGVGWVVAYTLWWEVGAPSCLGEVSGQHPVLEAFRR
jgi:hypothetical protein